MSKPKRREPVELADPIESDRPPAAEAACAEQAEIPEPLAPMELPRPVACLVPLEVPIGPPPGEAEYLSRHLEVRLLTPAQRTGLRRLWRGVDAAGERLASGKRPARQGDAIRWLLERIDAAGQESGESGAGTGDAA